MKIGLMGFDFASPNKGCEALTYSFVNMLQELVKNDTLELYNYSYSDCGVFPLIYPNIKFINRTLHMKNPIYWIKMKKEFDMLDYIFDVTYGDGFSDIYGKIWNMNTNMAKQLAIWSRTPFVLLPQTYGPYKCTLLKKWAINIINGADLKLSRDKKSADEVMAYCGEKMVVATDLAFGLPYDSNFFSVANNKTNIGINVSALLWEGGHDIKLRIDYQKYCREIIKYYSEKDDTVVHLIPHVIDNVNYQSGENDERICNQLCKEFEKVIKAPDFKNPIEAKSYICKMDVFIGARMHATIGALSSGVPTIPISYSKKFEGLFENIGYPYTISATRISTEEAVRLTKKYIDKKEILRIAKNKAMDSVNSKLLLIKSCILSVISK